MKKISIQNLYLLKWPELLFFVDITSVSLYLQLKL